MAAHPRDKRGLSLHTPLFDRFESGRPATLASLARDVADILGARRVRAAPGVLGWGLSGISGASATSEDDRNRIASHVAAAIERFEPRLRVGFVRDKKTGQSAQRQWQCQIP